MPFSRPALSTLSSGSPAALPLAALRLAALALAAAVLAYWALARTPTYAVPASLDVSMAALSAGSVAAAALFAVAAGALWLDRTAKGIPPLRWARALQALPAWWLTMPVAVAASYVATRMALSPHLSTANYWPAFGLWTASMALMLASFVSPSALARMIRTAPSVSWRDVFRSEALVVILLFAVAFSVRATKLDVAPPLVHVDEEAIALEGLLIVDGDIRNLFGLGWGANPTMGFLVFGVFSKIFGVDIVSARLVAATFGALGVVAMYVLLRELFGRWPALIGAIFLIGYQFHLHFSRVALNVVWDSALLAGGLYFAYRAAKEQRPVHFVAAAITSGIGLYLYHGTRVVPVVLTAYLAYLAVTRPRLVRANVGNLVLAAVAFVVVVMPIGAYFLSHEGTFSARLQTVGIFQSGWFEEQQDAGRSALGILWDQTLHAFGGYVYYGESSPFSLFVFEAVPLVGGLAAIPFIAGFAYSVLNLADRRYGLLLVAFVVPTVLGGALVVGTNNGQRLMSAVPAIAGFVAVGTWELGRHLLFWRRALLVPATVLASVALAAVGLHAYFDAAVDAHYGGEVDRTAVRYITALPRETRVYWFGAPALTKYFSPYSLYDRGLIEVFDTTPQDVGPVSVPTPSVYIFMFHRDSALPALQEKCPGGETRPIEFRGRPVLTVYELSEPNVCVPDVGAPDLFLRARPIMALPFLDFTTTVDAGVEVGEPLPCELDLQTVWYSFVAEADGPVVVDTDGSAFDTAVAVYAGTDLRSLQLVACNDDVDGTRSLVEFEARSGTAYYLQIAGADKDPASTGGLLQLQLTSAPLP